VKIKNKYLFIFLVAVLIRFLVANFYYSIFPEWSAGSSKIYRITFAESILAGHGFSFNGIPNIYHTPVYPFFLAIVFFILGKHWWSLSLFQGFLEGISSILISKIGARYSGNGWYAGLIYALYPFAITQSIAVVDTSLFVFLFIVSIYNFLIFINSKNIWNLILSSLCISIGILNRPSIVTLSIAIICYLIMGKYNWKLILKYTIIVISFSSIIPFLWLIRNYHLTEEFPIFAVGAEDYMWHAHNKHVYNVYCRGESTDLIGIDPRYPMEPAIKSSDFFKISPLEQAKLGQYCSEQVRLWVKNNKLEVIKYTFLKLKRFISWEYYPFEINLPFKSQWLWIYRLTNGPITIFGWIGLVILFFKIRRIAVFFTVVIIGFIFLHVISLFASRHKIPLDALFISLIPLSISYIYSKIKKIRISIVKN
jgi:hypothetical protein